MISNTARSKLLDGGEVHAAVVFPCTDHLDAARRMVHSTLIDSAEVALKDGDALQKPG
jgi:hypothetical protein